MTPIIEHSVKGRNLFVYEVEIEYQYFRRDQIEDVERQRASGKTVPDPSIIPGAYVRQYDAMDVPSACEAAVGKFDAFLQAQGGFLKSQIIRRCDLKFSGHVF